MAKYGKYGELNWHKGQRRWYKWTKANGKRKAVYFGPLGKGANDRACKKAAMDAFESWKNEREAAKHLRTTLHSIKDLLTMAHAVEQGLQPVSAVERDEYGQLGKLVSRDIRSKFKLDDNGYTTLDRIEIRPFSILPLLNAALNEYAVPAKSANRGTTIADHIDAWLDKIKLDLDAGELKPNTYKKYSEHIKDFTRFTDGKKFGSAQEVDRLLADYRTHLLTKVANKSYSPSTVNTKLPVVKVFIDWCGEHHILKDPPRQMRSFTKRMHVEKKGKPLSIDVIQKLWAAAGLTGNDRMKCWIALALNCGFKNGDVIALTNSMIQGDRLIGYREKTVKHKVPMNYKLWPITQQLIKEQKQRDGDDEFLFVNTKGGQITTGSFSALFKKLAGRAGVKATFEQLRDTSAEQVKQQLYKTGGEMGLLQVFLAHKDSSTASYYVTDDPAHLRIDKLDGIVDGLLRTYKIK